VEEATESVREFDERPPFHEAVPDDFIRRVFAVMAQASQQTFQVLTKRADRLASLGQRFPWPRNVWMGVGVETPTYLTRLAPRPRPRPVCLLRAAPGRAWMIDLAGSIG